jgi:hypothetical protein
MTSGSSISHVLGERVGMKLLGCRSIAVLIAALASAFCCSSTAFASSRAIWHMTTLDPVATDVAGFPLQVNASDNLTEWNELTAGTDAGPYTVLGFTATFAAPGQQLYNPYDGLYYDEYRVIWLNPDIYNILVNGTNDPYQLAGALMTLDHESMHQRLQSGDENRVNACALQDIPRLLTTDFGIPATVMQTVSVPVKTRVRIRYRVRHHGRWVYRHKYVTRTSYVSQTQTVPNPTFTSIVSAATAFYRNQPPSYNTGTCY